MTSVSPAGADRSAGTGAPPTQAERPRGRFPGDRVGLTVIAAAFFAALGFAAGLVLHLPSATTLAVTGGAAALGAGCGWFMGGQVIPLVFGGIMTVFGLLVKEAGEQRKMPAAAPPPRADSAAAPRAGGSAAVEHAPARDAAPAPAAPARAVERAASGAARRTAPRTVSERPAPREAASDAVAPVEPDIRGSLAADIDALLGPDGRGRPPLRLSDTAFVVRQSPPLYRGRATTRECLISAVVAARVGQPSLAIGWLAAGHAHDPAARRRIEQHPDVAIAYLLERYGDMVR